MRHLTCNEAARPVRGADGNPIDKEEVNKEEDKVPFILTGGKKKDDRYKSLTPLADIEDWDRADR